MDFSLHFVSIMFRTFFLVSFFLLILNQVHGFPENYYWREYTGSIPDDAVSAGKDFDGNDVYIGQVYLRNEGLIPAQIYLGVKEVYAPRLGIKKLDKYIKILCEPQENFYWIQASADKLHLLLLNKHAVVAGHQDGLGIMNVGRISYRGETKIGKVEVFNIGSAYFFFNDNGSEKRLSSYEVLMYNKSDA